MIAKIIFLSACVAALRAQTPYPTTTPVPILKQINKVNDDGSYSFGYEAADGSYKIETKYPSGDVAGKYGYVDETGKLREISYGAGSQKGFVPEGPGIQVPPPHIHDPSATNALTEGQEDDGQYREDPSIYEDPKYNSKNQKSRPVQSFRQAQQYQTQTSRPAYQDQQYQTQTSRPVQYQDQQVETFNQIQPQSQSTFQHPLFKQSFDQPRFAEARPQSSVYHNTPQFSFQGYTPQYNQPQQYQPQQYQPQQYQQQQYQPQQYQQQQYNPYQNFNPFTGHPAQNFDPNTGSYTINFTG